jgi:serine O-acetyltransferase
MSKILLLLYRISFYLNAKKIPLIPKLITYFNRIVFSVWLPSSTQIGKNCTLGKGGLGVVIHEKAVIGDYCIISNNVTIGGSSKKEQGKLPTLGNRVRVGAGCVILGDITIGDNVIIGSNSVVTKSIPCNTIVAGNPAKIIKSDIDINEYVTFK